MAKILEHLNNDYTEAIRDPLWQNIYLTPGQKELVALPEFQKLAGIKQLGPAYLVYPGATHTRLNHSLGVFHTAKRIIRRIAVDERLPDLSLEGIKAFLAAALLHDLGHFPYTHSFKDLPLVDHEVLTGRIILSNDFQRVLKEKVGVEPETVAAIVDESLPVVGSDEISFFRSILSGVLDPDKLDYLNRDAFFCGVPYGIQDTDFFIDKIVPTEEALALDEAGLGSVESLLFAKYQMYRSVYWHRTVRIATAMIKKAVLLGLSSGDLDKEKLYGLDDAEFYMTMAAMRAPYFRLARMVFRRQLLKTAYEAPFDAGRHGAAVEMEKRLDLEREIVRSLRSEGAELEEWQVILDIPEPISFEVDLQIHRNGELFPFSQSGSVFSPEMVEGFTRSLRKIRLFLPAETIARLGSRIQEIVDGIIASYGPVFVADSNERE